MLDTFFPSTVTLVVPSFIISDKKVGGDLMNVKD